jgi:divalent metal cation (Fe/Co/Zn/Cd) transporter
VIVPVELPIIHTASAAPLATPDREPRERERLIRQAKTLAWLSLAWMTIEGAVAISAALAAGSIALLGFGLDSVIEALASIIVIWRFTGNRRHSNTSERRAQQLVAISFFLLAPYIAQDAIRTLINGTRPASSPVGIALAISSIVLMPLLGHAKQRIGSELESGATAGEGTQNMLCAYLAAGVLAGLLLNTAIGIWWADPAIALAIAALAIHEGRQTWNGEGCCVPTRLPGTDACCEDDCCTT